MRDLQHYYKKLNSQSMQNESLSSIEGCSQYFSENLESQQNSIKQSNKEIIQSILNFQTHQQNNLAQQRESNIEKFLNEEQTQKSGKIQRNVQRSVFHNFQKHLVITLRQVIKVKKSSAKNSPQALAYGIWQIFLKQTRIFTKNILHIVFGVIDYESNDMTNLYDQEMLERFGFFDIFSQHSESLLSQAQHHLRSQTVKQLRHLDLKQFMKTRRIEHRPQFIEYVKQFMSELQQGPMRKRLPKAKKVGMKLRKDIHSK